MLDILLTTLFFKPTANLITRLTGVHNVEPVTTGAVIGGRGGQHLHDLSGFHLIIQRHNASIYLSPHHTVSHRRVNSISKIDNGTALRQGYHVTFGSEHENVFDIQIGFDALHDILSIIHILLIFNKLAYPSQTLLQFILLLNTGLIFPMGRNTVFRRIVHLPGADLHLKRNLLLTHHRGVQGLIHIGLRSRNVVLKAIRKRTEHLMHHA